MSNSNNFRVNELYDEPAVKEQIDDIEGYTLKSIKKIVTGITTEFEKVKDPLEGLKSSKTLIDLIENNKKAAAAIASYTKANMSAFDADLKRQKVITEQNRAIELSAKASKLAADTKVSEARAIKELYDAELKEAKARKENVAALEIEQRTAIMLTKEKERLGKLAEKEEANQKKLANAYEQLKKKYNETAAESKRLGAELGTESTEYIKVTAEANKFYKQLITLETAVGQNQRRVGAYRDATMELTQIFRELPAFAYSVQTGLLGISNNIGPLTDRVQEMIKEGQGVKAVFRSMASSLLTFNVISSVAVGLLTIFGDEIFSFGEETKKATKASNAFAEAQKEVSQAIGKEVTELNGLISAAKNVNLSYEDRGKAVDDLQKKFPDYFGNLNREKILNGDIKETYDLLTQSIVENAKARGRQSAIQKVATELAELQQQYDNFTNKDPNVFVYATPEQVANTKAALAYKKQQLEALTKEDQLLKDAGQAAAYWLDLEAKKKYEAQQAEEKRLALMTEAERREYERNKKKAPTDTTNTELSNLKRINKAKADMRMDDLEEIAQSAKSTYEYEKQAYEQRIEALNTYYSAQAAINEINKERELKDIQDNLNEIARIKNTPEGDRTPAQKQLLTQLEAFETEKQAIEKRYEKLSSKAERDKQLESIGIAKTYMDEKERVLLEGHMAEMNQLNTATNAELEALNNRYAQGIISEREYRAELEIIQNASLKSSLQKEIEYTKNLIKLKKARGEDTSALEKALSEISLQFTEATNKKATGAASKQTEELKKIQQQLYDFTNRLIELAADNKIKKLDEQQEALEYNSEREQRQHELDYKNELSRINATTLTEEERAEAVAKAEETKNSRITASQNQLQANSAAIDEMKRQIQKRAALGQAAIDTALAIGKITAEALVLLANPLTAAAAPFAFAQIPLAVANGAITLATINAAYKDGTPIGGHPGGPALVGDGYEHELVLEKGSKAWVTPNTPTLLPSLSAGAHVIPFSNTELIRQAGFGPVVTMMQAPGGGVTQKEMQSMFTQLYTGLQSESQESRRQDRVLHSSLVRTIRQKAIDPLKLRSKVNRIND